MFFISTTSHNDSRIILPILKEMVISQCEDIIRVDYFNHEHMTTYYIKDDFDVLIIKIIKASEAKFSNENIRDIIKW